MSRQSYGSFGFKYCISGCSYLTCITLGARILAHVDRCCWNVTKELELWNVGNYSISWMLLYHIDKPTQRRLVQADKVLCESVLSSWSFRLSSPNRVCKLYKLAKQTAPLPLFHVTLHTHKLSVQHAHNLALHYSLIWSALVLVGQSHLSDYLAC